jgi:hypothetical protein
LFGAALRLCFAGRAQRHFHGEARGVVGAGAFDHFIGWRLAIMRRRPFLKRGLGVTRGGCVAGDLIGPARLDEGARRFETMIQIERADQRLYNIAEHIIAIISPIVAGLFAEAKVRGEAKAPPDFGAGGSGHERVEASRERAFGFAGKLAVEPLGNDQTQNPVPQKFKPFIGIWPVAAVRQRAKVEREGTRRGAKRALEPCDKIFAQKPSPIRSPRAAVNQVQGRNQLEEPSVEKTVNQARPTRFSIGT